MKEEDKFVGDVVILVNGFNGKKFQVEHGDWIADKDGRSGCVVSVQSDEQLGEFVMTVDPGYGTMIDIRSSLLNYVAE